MKNMRGITCSLNDGSIYPFLESIVQGDYNYYAPWCLKNDRKELAPKPLKNVNITNQNICELINDGIYELVLHIYPHGAQLTTINTYDDFLASDCICCLIYYDCGFLDIYVKSPVLFQQMWNKLSSLNAENMEQITEENDYRTALLV